MPVAHQRRVGSYRVNGIVDGGFRHDCPGSTVVLWNPAMRHSLAGQSLERK